MNKKIILIPVLFLISLTGVYFGIGHIIHTGDDVLQRILWTCAWGGRHYGALYGPIEYSDGIKTIDDVMCKWMYNDDYKKYYESRTGPPMMNAP